MNKVKKIRISLNSGASLELHGADAVAAQKAIQYAEERDAKAAHFFSDDSNSDITLYMQSGVAAVQVFYGKEEVL